MAAPSKTGGSLKGIFDPAQRQAAEAVMEPRTTQPTTQQPLPHSIGARNRKGGGRNIRISGYVPEEISEALRDEVIRRMNQTRQTVSVNDVLCSILSDWAAGRKAES